MPKPVDTAGVHGGGISNLHMPESSLCRRDTNGIGRIQFSISLDQRVVSASLVLYEHAGASEMLQTLAGTEVRLVRNRRSCSAQLRRCASPSVSDGGVGMHS
jgi:hypothetical protein